MQQTGVWILSLYFCSALEFCSAWDGAVDLAAKIDARCRPIPEIAGPVLNHCLSHRSVQG